MTTAETASEGTNTAESAEPVLLRTENLTRQFGSLVAVNDVNLSIPRGEFHSIIGPNGAGKTTLFNMLAGTLPESEGRVVFDGDEITGLKDYERVQRGISRAFQTPQLFPGLTVLENLRLAVQAQNQSFNPLKKTDPAHERRAHEVLEQIKFDADPGQATENLSHGNKKKLELLMSLSVDPDLLLLDEPTSGVSHADSESLMEFISKTSRERTVLLIEHNVDLVLEYSDRITVLNRGEVISQGTPSYITDDETVQDAYMGSY
ncbi:ABC transporter ATP-binding protein [Halorientalis salina]|uniref:ABC transporter ATP-binding protein n=1 Tax=Halorientalis salina TaxID=2932266 RepID=UPI0010AD0A83|nr:ABC transporter ATP-binding protein [Halorientalis salina]